MKTNKKVIRKPKEANKFTLMHNDIINDKNLSSNAFRLLSSILSDNDDTFKLSQTTYCNRLGWEPTMFKRAIENLIKCGYVSRVLINEQIPGVKKAGSKKKIYYYTISEYGNLNKEEVKVTTPTKENNLDSTIIFKSFNEILVETSFKVDVEKLEKYIDEAYKSNKLNSVEQLSSKNIIKVINKFKIPTENEAPESNITPKPIPEVQVEVMVPQNEDNTSIDKLLEFKTKWEKNRNSFDYVELVKFDDVFKTTDSLTKESYYKLGIDKFRMGGLSFEQMIEELNKIININELV
jgi:hypothetical protein